MKSAKDMSKKVGVSPSTLYTLFYRGKIKGKKVETVKFSVLLDENSVLEYFASKIAVFTIMSSEEYAEELEREEKEKNNKGYSFLKIVFVNSAEKNKNLLQVFAEIAKNKSRRFVIPLLPEGVTRAQLYQYIFTVATLILSKAGTEEMQAEVKIKVKRVNKTKVKSAIKRAGFKNIEKKDKKIKTTAAVFKAIEKYAKKKKQSK